MLFRLRRPIDPNLRHRYSLMFPPHHSDRQCVSLNGQWPKAHVRLASAYIALGGHSNDACLSLQRALSLDRTNAVAREMLVKEMRRRNDRERSGESGGGSSDAKNGGMRGDGGGGPPPSSSRSNVGSHRHPTEETPRQPSPAPSAPPHPSESADDQIDSEGIDVDDTNPQVDRLHPSSISRRVRHHLARMLAWYQSQSDDFRTLLKVGCCLLVLYVALGGRFGLDYALGGGVERQRRRGNYGEGNAYNKYSSSRGSSSSTSGRYSSSSSDRYQDGRGNDRQYERTEYAHDAHDGQRRTGSTEYNDRTKPQNDRYYSRYGNGDDYYEPPGRRRSGGTSFHMVREERFRPLFVRRKRASCLPNTPRPRRSSSSYRAQPSLYDGSLVSMAIILVGGMICHRLGVNPVQAVMMLNLLQRRGGGARFGYGAYQGGGGGFGFGRQRFGFGRRGRGGYY
jgi:hypothetical protein